MPSTIIYKISQKLLTNYAKNKHSFMLSVFSSIFETLALLSLERNKNISVSEKFFSRILVAIFLLGKMSGLPSGILSHTRKVQSLYKRSLRNLESWYDRR